MRGDDKTSPNKLALQEIKNMPSLAGKAPRTAFNEHQVVLADLRGRGFHRQSEEPLNTTLLGFDSVPGKVWEDKGNRLD